MKNTLTNLIAGLLLLVVCLNTLQAESTIDKSLFVRYMNYGEMDKVQVLYNIKNQKLNIVQITDLLKNSNSLTTIERKVYADILKEASEKKSAEILKGASKISSAEKAKVIEDFYLKRYEVSVDWGGGFSWHDVFSYTYDNNYNMLNELYQTYDNETLINYGIATFYYDNTNNQIGGLREYWYQDSQSWINGDKWSDTLDNNHYITAKATYIWENESWKENHRIKYTYDLAYNLIEFSSVYYNENSVWENVTRNTYSYDEKNNLLTEVQFSWNGSEWGEFVRREFTYDENNNTTSSTFSIFGNLVYRNIFTYDEQNNKITETIDSWINSQWVTDGKYTNTFDSMNNLVGYLFQQSNGTVLVNSLEYFANFNQLNQIIDWQLLSYKPSNLGSPASWVPSRKGEHYYDANNNKTFYKDSSSSDEGLTWRLFMYEAFDWTSAATSVEDNNIQPNEYNLSQNYPNPFNPTTTIEYSISDNFTKQSQELNVTLKVYDILGNEVVTLVNENQKPGTYKINFNASNLASGMYIYKIQAGNFNQVRKMMLLK